DAQGRGDSRAADRQVDSVCPYCGVGCQLTYHIKDGVPPGEERRGQGEGEVRGPGMAEVASREGLVAPPRSPVAGSAPGSGRILFVEGRNGPSNEGRLCVKGRFGFDYPYHPARLT
ncbi:MAG: hypothetical protein ACQEXO_17830, partial [Pseudomonadota bacterium]